MNWQAIRKLTYAQVGAFLALLIVVFLPNYGIEKFGPSPMVPAVLLSLLGMWLVWRNRGALFADVAQRRWLTVFLLLFVPSALSLPGSFNVRVSAGISAALVLFYFTGVALIASLRTDAKRDWLTRWVAVTVALWVADAYVQLVFGRDLLGIALTPDQRVIGPFAGNLRLSLFACLLLPALLVWVIPRGWTTAFTAFVLVGAVALLSGSRAILVFLAIICWALLLRLPGGRRKWLVLIGILAAIAGAAAMLSPALMQRLELFGELHHPTFTALNHVLSFRLWIWDAALNMLAEHPFSGVGVGAFQAAYDHYSTLPGDIFRRADVPAYHAHQLYVGLAAETGLIGLLAFFAVVALMLRWYFQAPRDRRAHAWPFALGLLVYAFPLNSQPPLYMQWMFPLLVLLFAGMLVSLDKSDPSVELPKQV